MAGTDQWLWGLPEAGRPEQWAWVKERLAVDPAAVAISDLEAEQFLAWGYIVSEAEGEFLERLCHHYGVLGLRRDAKGQRRAQLAVLRRWKWPEARASMISLMAHVMFRGCPPPRSEPEAWTDEFCAATYAEGAPICWIAWVRRYVGRADGMLAWIAGLGEKAELYYRMGLDVARFTLRRLVYTDRPGAAAVEAVAVSAMVQELQVQSQRSGALKQDLRRLQQDRRQLKESVRRAELAAQAMLTQAQGEVTAARRALAERRAAQAVELAEQQGWFEHELARLRARAEAERTDFARALSGLPAVPVLPAYTVAVAGAGAEMAARRLQVESLGARLVYGTADLTVDAAAGFFGLESALRDAALQQVLIKTDGLCRRKAGRPAISVSAFEAYLGEVTLCSTGRTVCCGPVASSLMAEYGAVAMALAWVLKAGAPRGARVEVRSDCRALVARLNAPDPAPLAHGCVLLHRRVRSLLAALGRRGVQVTVKAVLRDEVYAVDRLCDRVYRQETWYHRPAGRVGARVKDFLLWI